MKLFLSVFLLSAVFSAVYGALAWHSADPNHPGHCYSKETGQMDYGEEKHIQPCLRASCFGNGNIQIASCGVIASPCGLLPKDLSKPYPDCCETPKPC